MDLVTVQNEIATKETFQTAVIALAGLEYDIKKAKVTDDESYAAASEMLIQAKGHVKALNELRLYATKPARKFTESINAMMKIYTEKFEEKSGLLAGLSDKMVEWKQAHEATARAAAAEQIKASNIAEMEVKAEMMTPRVVETDSGSSYLKDDVKVTCTNPIKALKAFMDGRNQLSLQDLLEYIAPFMESHVKKHHKLYSEKKWKRYGFEVVIKKKVATRT
jgi:ASC-1-like (ASCH) protein